MPDISMCAAKDCPLAKYCYRSPDSGTKPSGERQAWMLFEWRREDDTCSRYEPIRSEPNIADWPEYRP